MTRRRSDSRAARPASARLLARTVLLCAAGCGGLQVAFDDTRAGAGAGGTLTSAGAGGMLTSAGAGGTVDAGNGGTGWPGGAAGVAGSQPTAGAGAPEGGAAGAAGATTLTAGHGGMSDGAGQGGAAAMAPQGGAGASDGAAGSMNSAGQDGTGGENTELLCDPRPFRPEDLACRTYPPNSCIGTVEGWRGCRGTGCKVCRDAVAGYKYYLDHYPCCLLDQNPSCGDNVYRCTSLCPEPTVLDTLPKCTEVIDL